MLTINNYFPFGLCRISQGNLGIDRQFTGQILDSTGLYYYNARYYDPTIGRFISADTVVQSYSNPQTLNRYAYCLNNPLNRTDPTGKDYISDHGGRTIKTPPNPIPAPPVQSLPNLPISRSSSPIIVSVGAGAAGFWGDITGIWDNIPDPVKVVIGTVAGMLGAEISIPVILTGVLVISAGVCLSIPSDSPQSIYHDEDGGTVQTGGHTIKPGTAEKLNEYNDENATADEWRRALEDLKGEQGAKNDEHGKIKANGDYYDTSGKYIGNITQHLK